MNPKLLLLISFLASMAGIIILYTLSSNIELNNIPIEKINQELINDNVKILGKVEMVTNLDDMTILTVTQPSTINVIVFNNVKIYKNEKVEIIGKKELYNNNMEIVADKIRVI